MNVFTEKEKETLIKFRENLIDLNLKEERNADTYLIKWLRARDLNIPKAESMLRNHLKWRESDKIDDILSWETPEILKRIYPMQTCGYDKSGCPIVIVPIRFFDINEFWKCSFEEVKLFQIQNMEKLLQHFREISTPEKPITEVVILYDMREFNFRLMMNRRYIEAMQSISKLFNDNYPEMIHKAYFLYAPKVFSVLWAMFKHIVPKKTLEKFQIHGFNKEKWIPALQEHIDLALIPPSLGGTNEEFEKTAFAGLKVPGHQEDDEDDLSFTSVKVPPGKKHQIDYHIETPNSKLSWIFKTEDYDISFALIHEESVEIIPNSRVDSSKEKQMGNIICEKIGRYSLVFDNTYSRMRSKSLHFIVEVENESIEIIDLDTGISNGLQATQLKSR